MAVDIQAKIQGTQTSAGLTLNKSGDRLLVDSETQEQSAVVSLKDGLTFSVVSHDATAAAGTYPIYLKNDSADRILYVDFIRITNVETQLWKVWEVTGTAAGGSALTAKNFNLGAGKEATNLITARGGDSITGLTVSGSEIATMRVPANDSRDIPFNNTLILTTGKAIAVEADTDDGTPGIADIMIRLHFVDQ